MSILHISAEQLRKLHAVGRELGLEHDELHAHARDAYGVASLKLLGFEQARAYIEHLERIAAAAGKRPDARAHQRRVRPRRKPAADGVIRPASPSQRRLILQLLDELGWAREARAHFLANHGPQCSDIEHGAFSSTAAGELIDQLNRIQIAAGRRRRALEELRREQFAAAARFNGLQAEDDPGRSADAAR